METVTKKEKKNKGGRPTKLTKRLKTLSVKSTFFEAKQIEIKAKKAGLSLSEYLRELGLNAIIKVRVKTLPKEVLLICATLNHIAANLNQLARKRNSFDELSVLDRTRLQQLCEDLQQLVKDVKVYLQ
jgi:hypothetical protein